MEFRNCEQYVLYKLDCAEKELELSNTWNEKLAAELSDVRKKYQQLTEVVKTLAIVSDTETSLGRRIGFEAVYEKVSDPKEAEAFQQLLEVLGG